MSYHPSEHPSVSPSETNKAAEGIDSGVIRFEVDDVSKLNNHGQFSPFVHVRELPWRANVRKDRNYLEVDLYGINIASKLWSITVDCKCILINASISKNIVSKTAGEILCHRNNWFNASHIEWKYLIDEEKGFIKDDRILVEIHFAILDMQGIWIQHRIGSSLVANNHSDIALTEGKVAFVNQQSLVSSITASVESDREKKYLASISSGFISFEISVSDIGRFIRHSPVIEVLETQWRLGVKKCPKLRYLEVFLYQIGSESYITSFDVSGYISIVGHSEIYGTITRWFDQKFHHEIREFTFARFALWSDLIKKGFEKDGKITIEADFKLRNIDGIRTIPRIDFTDPFDPRHDVALVIDGERIYVGKQILAFHSPVFNAMFYGEFIEKNKKEIELKDVDRKKFIEILNLIYPSYQKITDANFESVLMLADRFEIKMVVDKVEQFLMESTEFTIPAKLKLADQHRLAKLQNHCLESFETVYGMAELKDSEEYKGLSALAKSVLMDKTLELIHS